MSLSSGSRVGPYDVLAPLGAGGMGEVWRARDTRLGREVALKALPAAFAEDRELVLRFQREAQLLATFNHPNIAAIYSFENVDGIQLLVMEMVPGHTVKELLARGPLSVLRSLAIARQTAEALDAAHGKGILHRDLKPANVKVTPDGKVKLLDFGLAKAFAPGPKPSDFSESPTLDTGATQKGTVLGTAPYMSPEQARGRHLDWRSDVWSFGCLLFEMLSGKRAFRGASHPDILVAILEREPDWSALPKETPPGILALLKDCLTKDLEQRAGDMAHIRQQLDLALEGKSVVLPLGRTDVSARIRRAPRVWATAGALLAVAVAVVGYLTLRERNTTALPASKLLAILPATDLTGRTDGRQLCDGVSFSLGVKLQSVPEIAIMRPSGPVMLKETDPAHWARDTGANLLVQPAVRQMGDQRQLSFSVFLAGSPVQVAAGEVTGPAAEHFRLEEELTRRLVAALRVHLASGANVPTPGPTLAPGPAQTDYVVALGYLEHRDDPAALEKAITLLESLPGAASSALVQAALARVRLEQFHLLRDPGNLEAGRIAAAKAVHLDQALFEAQVSYGRILAETGKASDAIPVLSRAVESRPGDVDALDALGFAQDTSGAIGNAEKSLRRATELRPTSWDRWNRLGGFLAGRGGSRDGEAAAAYRKAIALNPDVAPLYSNLGAVLLRLGKSDEARVAFRRSVEIRPNFRGYLNLGVEEYLSRDFDAARAAFQKAADLAPKNPGPLVYLADAEFHLAGRQAVARAGYGKAVPLIEAELRGRPDDPSTLLLMARCEMRLGAPGARATLARAVRLSPADTDVLYGAAAVAALAGRTAEALGWLSEARRHGLDVFELARDPDFDSLRSLPAFGELLKPSSTVTPKQ